MSQGSIVIVTGAPGSGKSSVSALLAKDSPCPRVVHLHADSFYGFVAKGFIEPWRAESHQQNQTIMEAIRDSAQRYAGGGFEVIVDGIVGPWFLEPWFDCARRDIDVHYLVLRASQPTTLARGTARTSAGALVDPEVIGNLWRQFQDLGAYERHAIDSTEQSLTETATQARRVIGTGEHRLNEREV